MFAHEFMRNALVAGSFVGARLRSRRLLRRPARQVFAGDALSHVAFTGALAPRRPASTSARPLRRHDPAAS